MSMQPSGYETVHVDWSKVPGQPMYASCSDEEHENTSGKTKPSRKRQRRNLRQARQDSNDHTEASHLEGYDFDWFNYDHDDQSQSAHSEIPHALDHDRDSPHAGSAHVTHVITDPNSHYLSLFEEKFTGHTRMICGGSSHALQAVAYALPHLDTAKKKLVFDKWYMAGICKAIGVDGEDIEVQFCNCTTENDLVLRSVQHLHSIRGACDHLVNKVDCLHSEAAQKMVNVRGGLEQALSTETYCEYFVPLPHTCMQNI